MEWPWPGTTDLTNRIGDESGYLRSRHCCEYLVSTAFMQIFARVLINTEVRLITFTRSSSPSWARLAPAFRGLERRSNRPEELQKDCLDVQYVNKMDIDFYEGIYLNHPSNQECLYYPCNGKPLESPSLLATVLMNSHVRIFLLWICLHDI